MIKAQAQERINQLEISVYPHMKSDDQKKTHKKLYELALPEDTKNKVVSTADLLKFGFDTVAGAGR